MWLLSSSGLAQAQAQSSSVVLGPLGAPSSSEVALGHSGGGRAYCHVAVPRTEEIRSMCMGTLTHAGTCVSYLCKSLVSVAVVEVNARVKTQRWADGSVGQGPAL